MRHGARSGSGRAAASYDARMKTLKPLLIVAIALGLAYALATLWVGHRVQAEMEEVAAALTARDDVRVTRFDYERGFGRGELHYDLTWQPVDADPTLQPLVELGVIPEDGFRLQGDLQVRQGPWVGGDAGFALGRTEGRVELPEDLRPLLPQYPGQEPLLRVIGFITFGGMVETHYRVVDYDGRVTPPDTTGSARLKLTGLQVMTRTTPQLDEAVIDARLDKAVLGFEEGTGSAEIELSDLFLEADAQEARPYLWTGKNSAGFGLVRLVSPEDVLALREGRISSDTWLENDQVHASTIMTFGEARLDGYALQGGEMRVSVMNLDADALAELSRLSNQYADTGGVPDTDEALAEFMPQFERLLAGNPEVAIERLSLAFQAPDDLVGSYRLSVEGITELSPESLDVLARSLRSTAELRLKQSALRYISRRVAAEQLGGEPSEAELDEAAAALYEMAIAGMQELPFVNITEEEITAAAELRDGVLYAGETEVMNVEQMLIGLLASMAAAGGQMGGGTLDPDAEPLYGQLALEYDFQPDPYPIELLAGGADDLEEILGDGCIGFVNGARPDVVLSYAAGPNPLYIFGTSEFDTTLAVLDPAGQWHCNDDSLGRGLNPGVEFVEPPSGDYAIWVGTLDGNAVDAILTISELGMF